MKILEKVYFSQTLADHNSIKKITQHAKDKTSPTKWAFVGAHCSVDWLQSLKQIFINESYQILVASLTLMTNTCS